MDVPHRRQEAGPTVNPQALCWVVAARGPPNLRVGTHAVRCAGDIYLEQPSSSGHELFELVMRPTTPTRATRSKEHERCGSHLMAPMLAANLAGTLLLKRAVERPSPLAGGAVALASTAAAVEVFAWSERNADSPVTQALKRPGYELQRLIGTREPDERQLEVGRAALAEILRVEDSN